VSAVSASFSRSLSIQIRVVGALLMREVITRYGRHNIGFFWLFIEPILFTLGVTAIWMATKATHGSNIPVAALYHRNVMVVDVLLARALLEVAGATFSLVLLSITFYAVGAMQLPVDVIRVLVAWAMLIWFSVALGIAVGALSEISETIDRVWHIFVYLLFPLSGAVFLVDWLPPAGREIVLYLPMVHATEMIRHGFFGDMVRTHYDLAYLAVFNAFLTLGALLILRILSRRLEVE
jgi:capsular polysaccharide transport system permease protein